MTTKERKKNPVPPFITSKLQQASRFPVKKTMMVAQQLYEGIELPGEEAPIGLITYMRTDSVRVADQALDEAREHIRDAVRRRVRARAGQPLQGEDHGAGRARSDPADVDGVPPGSGARAPVAGPVLPLSPDLEPLRGVADDARDVRRHDRRHHRPADYLFRAKGSVPKFAGWLAVYGQGTTEAEESERTEQPAQAANGRRRVRRRRAGRRAAGGDGRADARAAASSSRSRSSRSRPRDSTKARWSRRSKKTASAGRARTRRSFRVLQARDYVNKNEGKFRPTILGRRLVDKLLHPVFDDILDVEYTARMEDQLDEIEKGKADYKETLEAFYKSFKKDLKRAAKEMPNFKEGQPTGQTCDKCGQGEMVEKAGKFGIFLACNRYPDCDNTKELEPAEAATEELDETCENCGKPMVVKRGRFGMFLACTGYPECKTTRKIIATKQGMSAAKPDQILDEKCPNCGKNLVIKQGRFGEFTACTGYPECKYVKLEVDRRHLSQGRRRRRRAQVTPRQGVLRLRELSEVRLHAWNKPILEPCPKCGRPFLTEKITKRRGRELICSNEECGYVKQMELEEAVTT